MCDGSPGAYRLELDDLPSDEETRFLARQINEFNYSTLTTFRLPGSTRGTATR